MTMCFEILKNILKPSAIGVAIFFALNAFLFIGFFALFGYESLFSILLLYALSIGVAFSPVGEWILCLIAGARKMARVDMRIRMVPLLEIVYNRAKRKTPKLTNIIVLKVIYMPEPNAYAIGRRTICITEGLFKLPDDAIQGILAHEVAHLAYRHNEIQLLIGGGNFLITTLIIALRSISMLLVMVSLVFGYRNRSLTSTVVGVLLAGTIWGWTKFCMLFLMWSMRKNEYEADEYALELGYGIALAKGLDAIGTSEPQESFLRALYSTHPNTHDRIGHLQQMGAPYDRY